MARKGPTPRAALPPFDPARWAGQIARGIDIAAWADALGGVLAAPTLWDTAGATEEVRRAAMRRVADELRDTTPLYELTAALTVPWLLESLGGAGDVGREAAPTGPLAANLVALMRHLFDEPGILDYDPWLGLVDWLWSHQTAWAGAAIRRRLGTDSIRELSAEEYHSRLAEYLREVEPLTLRERSDQLLSTFAQELAKVVAEALALGELTPERRERLLARAPLSGPADLLPTAGPAPLASDALSTALADGHLPVMSSAHYHAVREALYLNTFERVADTPWPTARLALGQSRGQAQLRPPGAEGQTALPADQVEAWATLMWRQREELSDLDADALDALSALWLSQARSPGDRAVADVDGLLTMRGIQPRAREHGRRAGFRVEQRAEMHQAIAHIQNIWINIASVDDPDGVTRTLQSRAFVITDRYGVTDKTGTMVDMERFTYQPGRVFAHFLMGPGQQTALLSAKALKYDPYRQTWEKRLARFLSWQWRVGSDGARARPYRVGALLDACGMAINERFPSRTRERLEGALDTLQADEVVASWHYRDWDESVAQQRGWAEVWRAATLLIAPPEAVVAYYRSSVPEAGEPPRALPAPPAELPDSPVELGRLIRERRRALRANQSDAGTALGVSQSYISKLERGKIPEVQPSPEFRARLARWLVEV